MKEDFVGYDLAVKLKEKGFTEKCVAFYYVDSLDKDLFLGQVRVNGQQIIRLDDVCTQYNLDNDDRFFDAPTISQVLKWLREEHHIHFEIVGAAYGYNLIISDTPDKGGTDRYYSHAKDDGPNDGGAWDSFEDCVIYGIEYVIDNLI